MKADLHARLEDLLNDYDGAEIISGLFTILGVSEVKVLAPGHIKLTVADRRPDA